MEVLLVDLLAQVLVLVGIIVAGFVVAFLKKHVGVVKLQGIQEDLATKQHIIDTVVLFVQQVYTAYEGSRKFEIVLNTTIDWLSELGLSISDVELLSMIEASVKSFKTEFGDEWDREIGGLGSLNEDMY